MMHADVAGAGTVHEIPQAVQWLKEHLYQAPAVQTLLTAVGTGQKPTEFVRAAGSLPAVVAAAVHERFERPLLYIAPDMRAAERLRDDLRTLVGYDAAWLLPPFSAIPYDPLQQNPRFDERAGVLEALMNRQLRILITVPSVLTERFSPLKEHEDRFVRLQPGDEIDREALALVLTEAGMRREIRAEEPGSFAVRGAIIDLYPPSFAEPVRVELWGDEITELRTYDPMTQRSHDQIDEVRFYAGEKDIKPSDLGLWDIVPDKTVIFIDDPDELQGGLDRSWEEIRYQYIKRRDLEKDRKTPEPETLFHLPSAVHKALNARTRVIHRGKAASTQGAINLDSREHESYMGDMGRLGTHLRQHVVEGMQNLILCENESQVDRLEDILEEREVPMEGTHVIVGALHGGFVWPNARLAVLTDHQIFGRHRRTMPFRRRKYRTDPSLMDQLTRGDYVVHTEFGIGKYIGPKTIEVSGSERECLQLEYRDGVKVYVRLDQFSRLQKYQGTDGAPPKLSRIGGADWSAARKKTQKAVELIAKEVIELYARRRMEGGNAFSPDTPWQREMEAAFEFEDTPDQARAAEEIKQDMEKDVAMDRLLCGDVGFGKTEVAVRAVFKAVQDSKQVAILVPTTILAQQHYATFRQRLARYPIRVDVMSRFRSRKQQKETVAGLENGKVDVVIGTHRLLSRDIAFKDLGLIVIDEEHRFGVKHKERLKELRTTVDVLTMTATPIPRTLHMALSGARDMSMISTPPQDRLPIETEVAPFDERLIRETILREVARGGQVYFLHNRVQSIHAMEALVNRLVPGVKTGIAHGQMKENELEKVMEAFIEERFQVLICTMIIESGLDIPNVNTLIVNRADRFGLAQLYQLRGRIGRSHRQAYAYLLTPPRLLLNHDARRRLETLAEYTRLGSGFQIAMRDLEIRGAGNLLGHQQSGFINAVGFEMYTEMLAETVKRLSEAKQTDLPDVKPTMLEPRDVKVEVAEDAVLPESYVTEAPERVELYRRMSRAKKADEVIAMRAELRDRFGRLPEEAVHLLGIVETQARAAAKGIQRVEVYDDAVFVSFHKEWGGEDIGEKIGEMLSSLEDLDVELKGSENVGLKVSMDASLEWADRWQYLQETLSRLTDETIPLEVEG
ncbi:transcription-repair coupling factor [bacterium]|nr:transcription-repair coupling factor [bacterium]